MIAVQGNLYVSRKRETRGGLYVFMTTTHWLLLIILITLLGAWPILGGIALFLIGVLILYGIYLALKWMVTNWNKVEVPSWLGGDEAQWEDLHGWYKSNG